MSNRSWFDSSPDKRATEPSAVNRASSDSLSDSPLITGILEQNLAFHSSGRVEVALWSKWARIFATLRQLGPLLISSHNAHSAITTRCPYPVLNFCRCGNRGVSVQGDLELTFASWASARAIHQKEGGDRYSIEFMGRGQNPFHKVSLIPGSDIESFLEWVQVHQAIEPYRAQAGSGPKVPANYPDLHLAINHCGSPLPSERVRLFLHSLVDRQIPIRFLMANDGLIQKRSFLPTMVQSDDDSLFCCSETDGFQLSQKAPAEAHLKNLGDVDYPCHVLQWYNSGGEILSMLGPAEPVQMGSWVQSIADHFQD